MTKDEKNTVRRPHDLTMSDRHVLRLTGVEEVIGCDGEIVRVKTVMGELSINGMELHMGSFNRESGELEIDGKIKELVYSDIDTEKRGFLARLLR